MRMEVTDPDGMHPVLFCINGVENARALVSSLNKRCPRSKKARSNTFIQKNCKHLPGN